MQVDEGNSGRENGGKSRMWTDRLQLVLKLGRMKMTVFSAVTYGVAASLAGLSELDSTLFIVGWAFVFFTQMVAHFLGELSIYLTYNFHPVMY